MRISAGMVCEWHVICMCMCMCMYVRTYIRMHAVCDVMLCVM